MKKYSELYELCASVVTKGYVPRKCFSTEKLYHRDAEYTESLMKYFLGALCASAVK